MHGEIPSYGFPGKRHSLVDDLAAVRRGPADGQDKDDLLTIVGTEDIEKTLDDRHATQKLGGVASSEVKPDSHEEQA